MSKENQSFDQLKLDKKNIRWEVLVPGILIFGIAAIVGLVNNEWLTTASAAFFNWSLDTFGWMYAWVLMGSTVLVAVLCFSKVGKIRIGGKDAKAAMPFMTWFAMTLTGGIATGIVTWGVNEPMILYGNVWGELDQLGIIPFSTEAAHFAMGRVFFHWSFLPYAIYALCGVLVAYIYFNKKKSLSVTSTLEPLFGPKITGKLASGVIDTLSMLALGMGITSGLAMAMTLVVNGLSTYGSNPQSISLFVIVGIILVISFTACSYVGLDKGLKNFGKLNFYFFIGIAAVIFIAGPTLYILRSGAVGMAVWLDNFFLWGFDPIDIGGTALVRSWTMFNWAIWIAYAPVTALFLGMLSKGRTIREFMIVNWILPSVFGIVWFSIWSGAALDMQISGSANLVGAIHEVGAAMALWHFLQNLPFGIGIIVIPINIFIIALSYVTAADATITNLGSICVRDVPIGTQPPARLKLMWGVMIGIVGVVMAAFGGGNSGIDGVRQLAAAGGFLVLFIFAAMIVSSIKVFFIDKLVE